MSAVITELDYALNCAAVEIDTTNARAELAALRAQAAEAETLRATVAAQDAQLESQEKREYNLTCRALDTTPEGRAFLRRLDDAQNIIAAQARQLEQARELISVINRRVFLKRNLQVEVDHWLAANVPAQPDVRRSH